MLPLDVNIDVRCLQPVLVLLSMMARPIIFYRYSRLMMMMIGLGWLAIADGVCCTIL